MQREIKFRGLGENGWVYGDLFRAWAVGGIHPRIHWTEGVTSYNQGVKPETVGEFTGLKDFFEGDIILNNRSQQGGIIYMAGDGCWRVWNAHFTTTKTLFSYIEDSVVIGNIHENSELAEKESSNGDTVQD